MLSERAPAWRGAVIVVIAITWCCAAAPTASALTREDIPDHPIDLTTRRFLNDGHTIPNFGLGTYKMESKDAYRSVMAALAAGYRHIDTATRYGNEEAVGRAIRDSGIAREDVFITTKVYNNDQGYSSTLAACEKSLDRLGTEYIDLYLIHAPVPGKRLDTWRAMEYLQASGKVRSIGVSNYNEAHLKEVMEAGSVIPAVNQIEIHPWLVRADLIVFCEEHGIAVEGYSPLAKAQRLDDADLVAIALEQGKTPAQVLLRWSLQHNFITIGKSSNPRRIRENADVFDFALTNEQMALLNTKHEGLATGWNPVEDPAYA